MKLIIQIPCLNEEETLASTLRDLPGQIPGIDSLEVLVVDDGSTDRTAEVARENGVQHILSLGTNRGLAVAFQSGIAHALSLGADIVVNTDADNQYCGGDIAKLVQPILSGEADMVIGCRPIADHPEFSLPKKILQMLGSWTLRLISKTRARDAASGFRAFSRETCRRIFVHTRFSYCMETLIQAGNSGLRVASVDIRINPKTRDSRLFSSIPQYVWKSGSTMLAMFILYRPGRFFALASMPFLAVSIFLGVRFLYLVYWLNSLEIGRTHIPSLILLAVCIIIATLLLALGIIGELVKSLRRLIEEILRLQRDENQEKL